MIGSGRDFSFIILPLRAGVGAGVWYTLGIGRCLQRRLNFLVLKKVIAMPYPAAYPLTYPRLVWIRGCVWGTALLSLLAIQSLQNAVACQDPHTPFAVTVAREPNNRHSPSAERVPDAWVLRVCNDARPRDNQLMHVKVSRSQLPPKAAVVFLEATGGPKVVAQVGGPWLLDQADGQSQEGQSQDGGPQSKWLTFVVPKLSPNQELEFRLAATQDPSDPVSFVWNEERTPVARLSKAGQSVLELQGQTFDASSPENRDATYKVFHHLYMPNLDRPITKGVGGLYPHHRGMFYGFNKIRLTQNQIAAEIDTWHARQAHQAWVDIMLAEAGPVFGRHVVKINWVNEAVQPPETFAVEEREMVVYDTNDQRVVRFASRLRCEVETLSLKGDPQHAGFQFRAAQEVAEATKSQTYYIRPDGIDQAGSFRNWPEQSEHVNLPFHAMSFVVQGQRLTCVRADRSQNPRPARFSERDYGRFGCYFESELTRGQTLDVNYQLQVIPGEIDVPTAAQIALQFAEPPKIECVANAADTADSDTKDTVSQTPGSSQEPAADPVTIESDVFAPWKDLQVENSQPLFAGQAGQWDAAIRERGWILVDGDQLRLYYTGYDGTSAGQKKLGLATSQDGTHWQRHPQNPIYDQTWVEDMMVIQRDGIYWMFAEGDGDVAQVLKSLDGIQWELVGPLDIRTTQGEAIAPGPRGTPFAMVHGGQWYLFYERMDQGVWLARSDDMQVWTHVQDQAVMTTGPAPFDQQMIALNQVVPYRDGFLALFHGSGDTAKPRRWACGAAFSQDLIHWTKMAEPITPVEANRSSGILVNFDQQDWLYTMHPEVYRYKILAK